jgi:branched-chain amino acid transport system substrate-binding protein
VLHQAPPVGYTRDLTENMIMQGEPILAERHLSHVIPEATMNYARVLIALATLITFPALAQTPGVTATEIKIGNIVPYSGPQSAYGSGGRAVGAYFKMINEQGGVNGRKINYISYDDGYSPPKAVEMARRLVEQDQVALILYPLGTPSNSAIHKYMNQMKVPQLFVASGASKWNDPKNFPWTMGLQPSYQLEARLYAAHVLSSVKDPKIGILFQNDDYGKDYLKGFEDGLGDKAKMLIVSKQSYEATDPTVDSQVANLKNSGANVFLDITGPKFAAQAIKKAHDLGWKPTHYLNNVSTSFSVVLKPAGLDASKGLITALYAKSLTDPQWKNDKGYQDWLAWMKKYYPDGSTEDSINVGGYNAAQTLVQVLKQCGNDLSRENIMRQAANLKDLELPMLLPGIRINTGPDDFAPIKQAQLARFNGETWELFGEVVASTRN